MSHRPTVNPPPLRTAFLREQDKDRKIWEALVGRDWIQWFQLIHKRVGGTLGRQIIDELGVFEVTVGFGDVASAASKTLLDAVDSGEQWKVRELFLSGSGTNFSGGGGDRLLDITDGTTIWTSIPAATLQSLAAARWGDTGVPFPATAAHLTTASAAKTDIVAKYSGGSADYTAGSCTIILTAERTG